MKPTTAPKTMSSTSSLTEAEIAHFWSRVDIRGEDECWPWLGCTIGHGYGYFGAGGKNHYSHRTAFHLCCGDPEGVTVRHSCDNPPCCNPKHLLDGTQQDNLTDMHARGRARGNEVSIGEKHHAARMNAAAALEIWRSQEPQKKIADRLGVSVSMVKAVRQGRSWRHVTGAVKPVALS